jgi:hypothetical protein
MSEYRTVSDADLAREHRAIWIGLAIIGAVLLIVMYVTWNWNRDSTQAKAKAAELIQRYDAAGIATPLDADQVAKVYGTDGGTICMIGDHRTLQGYLKANIGVGGAFYLRATDLDRNAVKGALITASVYCPEQLDKLEDFVSDLKLRDVVRS